MSLTEQPGQASVALETEQTAPLGLEPVSSRSSPSVAAMSQREFCEYLAEDPSNIGAKAKRRGLSSEDYLKTIAKERKGENWQRELERSNKARWLRVEE